MVFWGGRVGALALIKEKTFSWGTVVKKLTPRKGGSHYMVIHFGKTKTKSNKSISSYIQLKGSRENQVVQTISHAIEGEK